MQNNKKNPKNIFSTIFTYFLIILLSFSIIGLLSSEKSPMKKNIPEKITYHEMLSVVEKGIKEKKEVSILERQEGKIFITIEKGKSIKNYETQANPRDSGMTKLIEKYDIDYQFVIPKNFLGVFFNIIFYGFLFAILWYMVAPMLKSKNITSGITKKEKNIPEVTFDDIGGLSEETKNEILQVVKLQQKPEQAKKLGIRPSKGIILHGPSGTGKTMIAKAIANTFQAEFLATDGSSFVEMFAGMGAKRVRDLFNKARKNAPAVIFIDEIDAVGKKRSSNGQYSNEEREQTLNQLLVLLDGIEDNTDVFVVAATNRLDILDDALLRPGRFDSKIKIDLPDTAGRKEIMKIHSKNKPLAEEVITRMDEIADSTSGFSGADLESLFEHAGYYAFSQGRDEITMEDINQGNDRIIIGNAGRRINDKETKRRVAYHEAGHAAVTSLLNPNSIRKATIVPRGDALGYVARIPKEGLQTRLELINLLKVMVAGGVAENMIYGNHSTGVSDDFKKAKELIATMVEDLGMGTTKLIPSFSEKDKSEQMKEIYELVIFETRTLLENNKDFLEKITFILLEKETIDGMEIEALKNDATLIE